MRYTFRTFMNFVGIALATHLHAMLRPLASAADYTLTRITLFFDMLTPAPMIMAGIGHPVRATRDVSYMTTGLHRLAQPRTRLGDPDDEDGEGGDAPGDDEDDGAQSDIRRH